MRFQSRRCLSDPVPCDADFRTDSLIIEDWVCLDFVGSMDVGGFGSWYG